MPCSSLRSLLPAITYEAHCSEQRDRRTPLLQDLYPRVLAHFPVLQNIQSKFALHFATSISPLPIVPPAAALRISPRMGVPLHLKATMPDCRSTGFSPRNHQEDKFSLRSLPAALDANLFRSGGTLISGTMPGLFYIENNLSLFSGSPFAASGPDTCITAFYARAAFGDGR